MKMTRRTMIKAGSVVTLAGAVMAGPGILDPRDGITGMPIVVYDERNSLSTRFADAFPAALGRFALRHGGALQYEELATLVAGSAPLVGLTGSSSFLFLQRLAADQRKKVAATGSHEPYPSASNIHSMRGGLSGASLRHLADHDAWVESLARAYHEMIAPAADATSLAEVVSAPGAIRRLSSPLHSWLLI